ncbi:MAG: hypothetical protein LBF08_05015 [Dysgonamonadaceae bacterium]|jgi:hypothetical protein|nr:hypothetical protein [Dysgonamonadaceae bacterium]
MKTKTFYSAKAALMAMLLSLCFVAASAQTTHLVTFNVDPNYTDGDITLKAITTSQDTIYGGVVYVNDGGSITLVAEKTESHPNPARTYMYAWTEERGTSRLIHPSTDIETLTISAITNDVNITCSPSYNTVIQFTRDFPTGLGATVRTIKPDGTFIDETSGSIPSFHRPPNNSDIELTVTSSGTTPYLYTWEVPDSTFTTRDNKFSIEKITGDTVKIKCTVDSAAIASFEIKGSGFHEGMIMNADYFLNDSTMVPIQSNDYLKPHGSLILTLSGAENDSVLFEWSVRGIAANETTNGIQIDNLPAGNTPITCTVTPYSTVIAKLAGTPPSNWRLEVTDTVSGRIIDGDDLVSPLAGAAQVTLIRPDGATEQRTPHYIWTGDGILPDGLRDFRSETDTLQILGRRTGKPAEIVCYVAYTSKVKYKIVYDEDNLPPFGIHAKCKGQNILNGAEVSEYDAIDFSVIHPEGDYYYIWTGRGIPGGRVATDTAYYQMPTRVDSADVTCTVHSFLPVRFQFEDKYISDAQITARYKEGNDTIQTGKSAKDEEIVFSVTPPKAGGHYQYTWTNKGDSLLVSDDSTLTVKNEDTLDIKCVVRPYYQVKYFSFGLYPPTFDVSTTNGNLIANNDEVLQGDTLVFKAEFERTDLYIDSKWEGHEVHNGRVSSTDNTSTLIIDSVAADVDLKYIINAGCKVKFNLAGDTASLKGLNLIATYNNEPIDSGAIITPGQNITLTVTGMDEKKNYQYIWAGTEISNAADTSILVLPAVEGERIIVCTVTATIIEDPIDTVPEYPAGILPTDAPNVKVYAYRHNLYVNSPEEEEVTVYSTAGTMLNKFKKPAGVSTNAIASTNSAQVLVVKGSSGWVRKLIIGNK